MTCVYTQGFSVMTFQCVETDFLSFRRLAIPTAMTVATNHVILKCVQILNAMVKERSIVKNFVGKIITEGNM